jgi:hypothetical protein
VWALARDEPWSPSYEDGQVCEEVAAAAGDVPGVLSARCGPGDRAELAVHLDLPPGLDGAQLERVTSAVAYRLSCLDIVAQKVDSLQLKPRPQGRRE